MGGVMTSRRRVLRKLSEDLELGIIGGIIKGVVPKDAVEVEEVSKLGRYILVAVRALDKPTVEELALHAVEVQGAPRDILKSYLHQVSTANAGLEMADILRKVRDKQILLDLINEASKQISSGDMDVALLGGLMHNESTATHDLVTVSERLKDGLPPKPVGFPLRSLPYLSQQSGGVMGVWAVGGEPGVGKSTLAWQITLDVAQQGIPVLDYDFENGFAVLMDHTKEIYKGNMEKISEVTKNIYVRDSIRSLDSDLARVAPPALIVVDSIQKLPGSVEHRRTSLDKWIHRLEYLKKRGYTVLLVSEIGRAAYGSDAYIGAYKETGEIEYSADFGLQLLDGGNVGAEAHIVKNRHRPFKGHVAILQRERAWFFKEIPTTPPDAMVPQEIN
jgi:hypothetical protein